MAQITDSTEEIVKALANVKDRQVLVELCTKKYLKEIPEFLIFHKDYLDTKDPAKRKEKAQIILVKFLTLDGDSCLPDHVLVYKTIERRMKRLEKSNESLPDDLFQDAYDKVLFTIKHEVWLDFLDKKQ